MLSQKRCFEAYVACIGLAVAACTSAEQGRCDPADDVATPGGPRPGECVHEVPSGATVTIDEAGSTVVTLDGKVVATYPPCPCSSESGEAGAAGTAGAAGGADG